MTLAWHRLPVSFPSLRQASGAGHWLEGPCAWAAFLVPLVVGLLGAATSSAWRDDLALVQSLGLVPLGAKGCVSSIAIQIFSFLPLGGRVLRASLASVLGLSLAAALVHQLARRALAENANTPRLTPLLAASAALGCTLSLPWQLEGTLAGGGALGAALALAGLALLLAARDALVDARLWLALGALGALAAFENHNAGFALVLALSTVCALYRRAPTQRALALFAFGAACVAILCLGPLLLRPPAGMAAMDFARSSAPASASERFSVLGEWLHDTGFVWLGMAALGTILGLTRRRTRPLLAPLVVWCLADLLLRAPGHDPFVPDAGIALRLLCVAAFACLAAFGLQTLVVLLARARIPYADAACQAAVVFQFTLVLMSGEDAAFVVERRSRHAADVWTDEALAALPPNSALILRSPALLARLWAARSVRGERPDLLIVPLERIERGRTPAWLVELEPALKPLIREIAINGKPSEYALSTLADARPLHVEFDRSWDPRLFDHLLPGPQWLRFAPHALGRSDRAAGLRAASVSAERVLAVAKQPVGSDEATLALLAERSAAQTLLLALLGDRDSARAELALLKRVDAGHPLIAPIEKRLGEHKRVGLELTQLLERR
jgi:hypothetical protein